MSYECMSFADIDGFDWDDGNRYKNQKKHGVSWQEIEEIFFNEPLLILEDEKHSVLEQRCYCLGQTDEKVKLFVVFTKRENKIRPISARRVTNKERAVYEKAKKNTNF